jgi:hypothetical protein
MLVGCVPVFIGELVGIITAGLASEQYNSPLLAAMASLHFRNSC